MGVNGVCAAVSNPLSVPVLHTAAAVGEAIVTGQSIGGNGSRG